MKDQKAEQNDDIDDERKTKINNHLSKNNE